MTTRTLSLTAPESLQPFGRGNPNYHRTQEAQRHQGMYVDQTECCCVCGKKAFGKSRQFVYLTDLSQYITKEECQDHDLGMYPVGSDCAKKLNKAGVPTYKVEV